MPEAAAYPAPDAGRNVREKLCRYVLLVIFLAASGYAFFRARTDQASLLQAARLYNADAQFSDWLFKQQAARGNLTLQLQGFDPFATDQRYLMYRAFIRDAYLIYPTRIYLGDDSTPVGLGFQANPFPPFTPTPEWEAQHKIKTRMTITRLPDGLHQTYSVLPLPD